MADPLVSVIMPVYNGEKYVAEAIESIIAQTFTDWELIIVNDASPDASDTVIAPYLVDPRMRYFAHETNQGIAGAYNTAFSQMRGKYIAIQEYDDVSFPEKLARQAAILEQYPDIAFVFSPVLFMDLDGHIFMQWGGEGLREGVHYPQDFFYKLYIEGDCIPNPSAMLRADLNIAYDPRLKICNDFENYLKICHDHPAYFCATPQVKMRRGDAHASVSSDTTARFKEEQDILQNIRKMFSQVHSLPVTRRHYAQAMARQYYKEGRYYFSCRSKLKEFVFLLRALIFEPKNKTIQRYMINRYLPPSIIKIALQVKGKMRSLIHGNKTYRKKFLKVAIVAEIFPIISETFILNHIIGLMDLGCDVEIFAEHKGDGEKVHPDIFRYDLLSKVHYIDNEIPKNKLRRIVNVIPYILKGIFKNPFALIKALNFLKLGKDVLTLRTLYFMGYFLDQDIIHCHFGPNALEYLFLKDMFNVAIITSFHGYDVSSFIRENGNDIYKKLFERGDLFTANSECTKKKLMTLGCEEKKIVKIPVGLNVDNFVPKERERTNVLNNKINILTVARLVEEKGVEYAIQAVVQLIIKYGDEIVYKIAGDGPLKVNIQKHIRSLGMEKNIILLGWRDSAEIKELYQTSNIFILPSIRGNNGAEEGQGLVLQEAQAMELPVISSKIGGIPEGVIDGTTGFLVPERDVDALADRIEYLIQHPEKRFEMGRAGREFVEGNFDVVKLNERLVEIYKNLIGKYR